MADSRFPPGSSDSNKSILTATGLKGDQGDPALSVVLQVPSVIIPCDNDASNPVYTNAESQVQILKAGLLQTGWTLAYVSGVGCVATVDNGVEPREVSITSISADSGYANFTAIKSGEITQVFRFYFARGRAGTVGATGSTGSTGSTGAAGPTGAAGADGTGVVLIKKSITIETGVTASSYSDGGASNTLITFSSAHGYSVGDWIHVVSPGGVSPYHDEIQVQTTPLTTTLTVDIPYVGTGNPMVVYPMDNFRSLSDQLAQNIVYPDIFSTGMKLLEIHLVCIDGLGYAMNSSLGDTKYPASGFGLYFIGEYTGNVGQLTSRDLRSSIPLRVWDVNDDLWFRMTTSQDWSFLAANNWELHIAYINFDLTFTP